MEGRMVHARNVIAEREIPYRPRFTTLTGRITASVLLQQMIYYWDISKQRPFYKFRAPCTHDRYVENDSWLECLCFSPAEFDTALKTIGTKITKGVSRTEALKGKEVCNLILYWTDSNRMTWYELNVPLLDKLLDSLYSDANSGKCKYRDVQESHTSIELENPELHSSQIPEITQKIPPPNQAEQPPVKANVSRLLRSTITQGEDDSIQLSALAEYIGQQLNSPVPAGGCNKLAIGYTEQLSGGRQIKHPSPDQLWLEHPRFPEWVDLRIQYIKGKGGSNAARRSKAVNAICQYKGGQFAWLEWLAAQPALPHFRSPEEAAMREEMPTEIPMSVIPGFRAPLAQEQLRQELERQRREGG